MPDAELPAPLALLPLLPMLAPRSRAPPADGAADDGTAAPGLAPRGDAEAPAPRYVDGGAVVATKRDRGGEAGEGDGMTGSPNPSSPRMAWLRLRTRVAMDAATTSRFSVGVPTEWPRSRARAAALARAAPRASGMGMVVPGGGGVGPSLDRPCEPREVDNVADAAVMFVIGGAVAFSRLARSANSATSARIVAPTSANASSVKLRDRRRCFVLSTPVSVLSSALVSPAAAAAAAATGLTGNLK